MTSVYRSILNAIVYNNNYHHYIGEYDFHLIFHLFSFNDKSEVFSNIIKFIIPHKLVGQIVPEDTFFSLF